MTVSLRSDSLSTRNFHRPPTPSVARVLKISTPFSTAPMAVSPIRLTILVRIFVQVRPRIDRTSLMMPLRSRLSGTSMPASESEPNRKLCRPFLRWSTMLRAEVQDAALHRVDEVAEEADRVLDDLADRPGRPGQDAEQHVLELEDRPDRADDGVLGLVPQALVGRLQLLDLLVDRVAGLGVAGGEVVDEGVLLVVDVGLELVELVADLPRRRRRRPSAAPWAGRRRSRRSARGPWRSGPWPGSAPCRCGRRRRR